MFTIFLNLLLLILAWIFWCFCNIHQTFLSKLLKGVCHYLNFFFFFTLCKKKKSSYMSALIFLPLQKRNSTNMECSITSTAWTLFFLPCACWSFFLSFFDAFYKFLKLASLWSIGIQQFLILISFSRQFLMIFRVSLYTDIQ